MASPPSPFDNLPEISFAQIDVTALQEAIITGFLSAWEADTGESLTLLPSDRRYNFLSSATAWLIGAYATLDTSAKQNLIPFATGGFLDNIGAFFDIGAFSGTQSRGKRLPASPAVTELAFSLTGPVASASIIPKGTQVASASTGYIFSTDQDLTILSGLLAGYVSATCTVTGAGANDLGDVSTLVNWSGAFVISALNTSPTQGGADVQNDEDFRLQLYSASDSYSNAGSYGAYEFFARKASPAIADVSVAGPEDIGSPGDVLVTVLLQNGEFPDAPFCELVADAINPENIRDLCANVSVAPPSGIPYTVQVRYWVDSSQVNNVLGVQTNVNAALNSWVTGNSLALGGAINPSTLATAVMEAGASYVLVDSPAARIGLSKWQVGVITDDPIAIYQGVEDDLPV
jgi:phage-related baseplate assembly protein